VTSASKAFNVPGVKGAQVGTAAAADAAALAGLPTVANHGTSPLGVAATIAAYTAGGPWLDDVVAHLDARRAQFGALLALLPGVRWWPMEATYLAWVDASAVTAAPARDALTRGMVMVNDGDTFGPGLGYGGHVRVNLATSEERLERVVRGLAAAWVPPGGR
jgi:cystathionine beta-lyase